MPKKETLSKDPYKGVSDFYPEEQFIENYIFNVWRKTAESFGYKEYNASILEPADLYRGKTSEEIVNEQTYTFKDRGGREVTLRPEMTPTVARMIARKKRDLIFPLRWFSIPNVFRYERPQRGRMREHWQLNIDVFGLEGQDIEVEIISLAHTIMKNFGLSDNSFEIRISDREILSEYLRGKYDLNKDETESFLRLLDKKDKIKDFDNEASKILGGKFTIEEIKSKSMDHLLENLASIGVTNAVFDPTIVRGFQYYTGMVFEIFDTDPKNNRSLFGGGRYDDLLSIFGEKKIPAVGFGMGNVTIKHTLESNNLLPEYSPSTDLYICVLKESFIPFAQNMAAELRLNGINSEIDMTLDKVGAQIRRANKGKVPFVVCIGENEIKVDMYTIKDMRTGKETKLKKEGVAKFIKENQKSQFSVRDSSRTKSRTL